MRAQRRRRSRCLAEPLDIIGAPELVGWPELTPECMPEPLYRYVVAEAEQLNVVFLAP